MSEQELAAIEQEHRAVLTTEGKGWFDYCPACSDSCGDAVAWPCAVLGLITEVHRLREVSIALVGPACPVRGADYAPECWYCAAKFETDTNPDEPHASDCPWQTARNLLARN